jgi:hypothetical protein
MSARAKVWFYSTRNVNWRLHGQVFDSILHNCEFYGDYTCHFDGAAKGDFAIALGEMEVAYAEFGAGDVDGEVDFGAAREVFDVAVAAVFGAARNRAGTLFADFGLEGGVCRASVDVCWVGGLSYVAVHVRAFGD